MELNIEAPGELAEDLYVQVRVGDASKHAKLANTRTFRFPKSSASSICGRIDLFQRVGGGCVSLIPSGGQHDISVDCGPIGDLTLHVGIGGVQTSQFQTKMKQAKDYLGEHGIQAVLADATKALLRDRPDDPYTFLSSYIVEVGAALKRGNPQSGEQQQRKANKEQDVENLEKDTEKEAPLVAIQPTVQQKRILSRRLSSKRMQKRPPTLEVIAEGSPGEEVCSPSSARVRSPPDILSFSDNADEAGSVSDEAARNDSGSEADEGNISDDGGLCEDTMMEDSHNGQQQSPDILDSPEVACGNAEERSPEATETEARTEAPEVPEVLDEALCGSALTVARALRGSAGSPSDVSPTTIDESDDSKSTGSDLSMEETPKKENTEKPMLENQALKEEETLEKEVPESKILKEDETHEAETPEKEMPESKILKEDETQEAETPDKEMPDGSMEHLPAEDPEKEE